MAKKAKLGSGVRFKAIEEKAAASGAKNPAAVAAAAGRKAHGEKAMVRYSKMGKARKEHKDGKKDGKMMEHHEKMMKHHMDGLEHHKDGMKHHKDGLKKMREHKKQCY